MAPEQPARPLGQATAFAPACVGNVAVGYDLLGHAVTGRGDRITVQRCDRPGAFIRTISGCITDLPRETPLNTASRAVQALYQEIRPEFGFEIDLEKGVPLGSGLGGSAASATAALTAANALLDAPLPVEALYPFAVEGEVAASGGRHGDNVAPQLLGGLVAATAERMIPLPVPAGLTATVVHPHMCLETRRARQALEGDYKLEAFVRQSAGLTLVISGCFRGDLEMVAEGLSDHLVEPRRAGLIPGFAAVRQAALDAGALGASISGAGPTVFGWFEGPEPARRASEKMVEAFAAAGLEADGLVSPVDAPGARLIGAPR